MAEPHKKRICYYDDYLDQYVVEEHPRAKTNNQLEYIGLLAALAHIKRQYKRDVQIRMDSMLVVKQIHGDYACNNRELQLLLRKVRMRIAEANLVPTMIGWVPREENKAGVHLDKMRVDEKYKRIE